MTSFSVGSDGSGNPGMFGNFGSSGSDGSAGNGGIGSGMTSFGIGSDGSLQWLIHFTFTALDIAGCNGEESGIGTGSGGLVGPNAVMWVWVS